MFNTSNARTSNFFKRFSRRLVPKQQLSPNLPGNIDLAQSLEHRRLTSSTSTTDRDEVAWPDIRRDALDNALSLDINREVLPSQRGAAMFTGATPRLITARLDRFSFDIFLSKSA